MKTNQNSPYWVTIKTSTRKWEPNLDMFQDFIGPIIGFLVKNVSNVCIPVIHHLI